jgi:hypothetical protein
LARDAVGSHGATAGYRPTEYGSYEALDNGFLSCADPERLQQICDSLGPEDIDRLFRKWLKRLPLPLRPEDRAAGYGWTLSIWQLEVSLTQIFDRPLRGREFFEEIIRDNLDLGRPDRVQLIFDRVVTKKTPGEFRTRVIQEGVHPSLHIQYKNFDLKQYFKEGRGCRTEGTFRNPKDFGINKGLSNLHYLRKIGREINRRLLIRQSPILRLIQRQTRHKSIDMLRRYIRDGRLFRDNASGRGGV